jgi:predicted regulator of Ras-like GTPase activity (Roadblock/LC7/MglB family)
MAETPDALMDAVSQLRLKNEHVQGAAVITTDGFILAADIPGYEELDELAAHAAHMLDLAAEAVGGLNRGALGEFYARGDEGYALLTAAGEGAFLLTLCDPDAKLGLVLVAARNASKTIAAQL